MTPRCHHRENNDKNELPVVVLGAPLRGEILTKNALFVKIAFFPEHIAKKQHFEHRKLNIFDVLRPQDLSRSLFLAEIVPIASSRAPETLLEPTEDHRAQ